MRLYKFSNYGFYKFFSDLRFYLCERVENLVGWLFSTAYNLILWALLCYSLVRFFMNILPAAGTLSVIKVLSIVASFIGLLFEIMIFLPASEAAITRFPLACLSAV